MATQSIRSIPAASYERGCSDVHQAMIRNRVQNDAITRTDLPIPINSNLMVEGFTYQKYRVGGPPLQILPLQGFEPKEDDPAYMALEAMLPDINYILAQNQVKVDYDQGDCSSFTADIQFLHRFKDEGSIAPEDLIILIPAMWDEAQPLAWLRVVSDLRAMLVQTPRLQSVKVELIGRPFYRSQTLDVVQENHPIVEKWDMLQTQLHGIISQSERLRTRMCSLGVVRMGYLYWLGSDPLPTVVLVVVNWDIDPHEWNGTQSSMRDLLCNNGLSQVDVVFMRGEMSASVFSLQKPKPPIRTGNILPDKAYSTPVYMGADLGPAKFFTTDQGKRLNGLRGTMGGYVKVTNVATGDSKRMGITNHHVARDAMEGISFTTLPDSNINVRAEVPTDSEVDIADRHGMGPDHEGRQRMRFESSSRRNHISNLHGVQNELKRYTEIYGASDPTNVELRNEYNNKKAFFKSGRHILGTIWASSGFNQRTKDNGRLDWALIDFQDSARVGRNTIPPAQDWTNQIAPPIAGQSLKGIGSCRDPKDRKNVAKVGSSRGVTKGEISRLRHTVRRLPHDDRLQLGHSSEYALTPSASYYCSQGAGDSSSAVFTTHRGKFMGLVWGGLSLEMHTENSIMYVIDAEAMLEDMNDRYSGQYTFELAED